MAEPANQEAKQSWEQAISQKKLYEKNQLESLVQRYPNDYGYRYELGVNLFENEDMIIFIVSLKLKYNFPDNSLAK